MCHLLLCIRLLVSAADSWLLEFLEAKNLLILVSSFMAASMTWIHVMTVILMWYLDFRKLYLSFRFHFWIDCKILFGSLASISWIYLLLKLILSQNCRGVIYCYVISRRLKLLLLFGIWLLSGWNVAILILNHIELWLSLCQKCEFTVVRHQILMLGCLLKWRRHSHVHFSYRLIHRISSIHIVSILPKSTIEGYVIRKLCLIELGSHKRVWSLIISPFPFKSSTFHLRTEVTSGPQVLLERLGKVIELIQS